ncbi:hypothetical protein BLNAU_2323 [Blattamonas nauphoetae]|uniref:Uncharacterized protein n=1 Tax=Blattamonas nauphoetae TaxID=2049346 RepID=A0ABQ9YFF1_9EUKA|nr:hypothetical protein BLNAU_2323 [Blattamonas nauphoetae]
METQNLLYDPNMFPSENRLCQYKVNYMDRMFHEHVTSVRTVLAYPNKGTLAREIKALLVHIQSLSNVFLTLGRDDSSDINENGTTAL